MLWPAGSPGAGGGAWDGGHGEDRRFSAAEMGALGGVLGALLLLALLALGFLVHQHYGPRFACCSSKALVSPRRGGGRGPWVGAGEGLAGAQSPAGAGAGLRPGLGSPPAPQEAQPYGFDNKAFLPDDREPSWCPAPSPVPSVTAAEAPPAPRAPSPPPPPLFAPPASPSPPSPRGAPESSAAAEGGPAGVRSILTKERRPEGGYKAVWFGENIGAEADVVVINDPFPGADGAGDSGSEGSGDEGADAGPGRGPRAGGPDGDSTYI